MCEQARRVDLLTEELRHKRHRDVRINAKGEIMFQDLKPPMYDFKNQLKVAVEDMLEVAKVRQSSQPDVGYMFVRSINHED